MTRTIFIVDDDPDESEILGQALAEWGGEARVRVFDDPIQALDALAREPADVLITDLSMPWADGQRVLESARKTHPGLVTVLISAYPRGAKIAATLGARFVQKPVDLDVLLAAVGRADG